ncbi:MAG TPA: hypothetical protein DCE22_03230, partial [Verrucomicrobiales bacterium]|nr:hypothetical protein [Verrucomicrobiales bacterium]
QGQGQGQGQPSEQGNGDQGNYTGTGGAKGPKRDERGTSKFIGLPKRERGTLNQSKSDSYPAEYGSLIQQYLKNLSDKATNK